MVGLQPRQLRLHILPVAKLPLHLLLTRGVEVATTTRPQQMEAKACTTTTLCLLAATPMRCPPILWSLLSSTSLC